MKRFLSILAIALIAVSCDNGIDYQPIHPDEKPDVQEKTILFAAGAGKGSVHFECKGAMAGKSCEIYYYIPKGDIENMPVQFVIPGVARNGSAYRNAWVSKADQYGVVILTIDLDNPPFTEAIYQRGNIVTSSGKFNKPEDMIFPMIDDMFDFFLQSSNSKATKYNIWGHSAGAQFTHRYMEFGISSRVNHYIAANPGWYTFIDSKIDFPYGIGSAETIIGFSRATAYGRPFTLMLGTADTVRDSDLRVTAEADAQGKNRYERGNNFFNASKKDAESRGLTFKWDRVYVQGVGHDYTKMAPPAADYLYGNKN